MCIKFHLNINYFVRYTFFLNFNSVRWKISHIWEHTYKKNYHKKERFNETENTINNTNIQPGY